MAIYTTSALSVDIGNSNLKLIQTSADGKINKFVVHKLPEGCVDDLSIIYPDVLVKALKKARRQMKRGGKCSLVVSGADIITRQFTLPVLSGEQMYQNVVHEVAQYLPADPDKYYIDYKIAGTTEEEGIKMNAVLVTCVHKRVLDRFKKVLKLSGFTLSVVDTCENACEKLLKLNSQMSREFSLEGGICLLDLGSKHTRVSLYDNGAFFAGSLLKRSGQSLTEAIAKALNTDVISSEMLKREADYLNLPHHNAALKAAVTAEMNQLLQEINRVLDFYRNRTKQPIRVVYTSGGGALMPGLNEYMQKNLGVSVYSAAHLIPTRTENKPGFALLANGFAATLREEMP